MLSSSLHQSSQVVPERDHINPDRHEAVIDTTEFRTLTVIHAQALKQGRSLVQTARNGVQLDSGTGNSSGMDDISAGQHESDVSLDGENDRLIDLKQSKVTLPECVGSDHVAIVRQSTTCLAHITVLVRSVSLVTHDLDSHGRANDLVEQVKQAKGREGDCYENQRRRYGSHKLQHGTVCEVLR